MSCTGKPKFATEVSAQKALKNTVPGLKTIHLCQACGSWHLGDKPKPATAKKARKLAHYARR